MDGVKRYALSYYNECGGYSPKMVEVHTLPEPETREVYWLESAAQAREAALREELATTRSAAKEELDGVKYTRRKFRHERDSLQQRLTAAEQRNADDARDAARYRWLRNPEQRDCVPPELDVICGVAEGEDVLWFEQLDRAIDAALKPTESGASA